ncbi:hypothetical protein F751_2458 [Auxenochlorella protothecoides]|uniref:Uncharacterized protein n=1 Tax=Auxenochlorella protothecoides TaxID=3075 RepID=A0A087SIR2_AUXPR|nr:hypothetical protein F751_2458 [Auxenochlorella protothecoides]KFM25616.1 hypothetical protein F751_2458 [Auxenochlorella protothecoides]
MHSLRGNGCRATPGGPTPRSLCRTYGSMRDGAPGCCARSAFWRETILPETLSATALLAGNVPSHVLQNSTA